MCGVSLLRGSAFRENELERLVLSVRIKQLGQIVCNGGLLDLFTFSFGALYDYCSKEEMGMLASIRIIRFCIAV